MKSKMLAAGALLLLSTALSACGGTASTTPTAGGPGGVDTGATTTAMTTGNDADPTKPPADEPTAMATTGTGGGMEGKRKIVVSSKGFTEAELLGEMYAQVLEGAGVPVDRKLNLGTEVVAQAALVKGGADGGIDLYPEYTSTGLTVILKQEPIYDPPKVYEEVKKGYKDQFKLTWLDASPMNDTQAMVTTKEVSDRLGIKSLEDLCAKAGEVTVAAVAEFSERADALPLLKKTYGDCNFKEIKVMEANLRYGALLNKQVDIAQAFSTDGAIAGNGLVLLADPKNYGLPYNVAPVVRDDVLEMYPQIAETLNKLSPKITNEVISALNWEVDGKGRTAAEVAKEFLVKEGMVK